MTCALPSRPQKGNFITFRYASPKQERSNAIFRAAALNIEAPLSSQPPHQVSGVAGTGQRAGCRGACFTAAGTLRPKLLFLVSRKVGGTEFSMFCPSGLGLESPQFNQKAPVTNWEAEYLYPLAYIFLFLKTEVVLSSSDWRPP